MRTKRDKQTNNRYKLVGPSDPVLWRPAEEVKPGDDLRFIDSMDKILRLDRSAVGLAAPQIGINKRVILVASRITQDYVGRMKELITVAVNPLIVSRSDETNKAAEGCLSFPGIFVEIERYNMTVIRFQFVQHDYELEPVIEKEFWGWESRVWQHEIDHLDGICQVGDQWRSRVALHTACSRSSF